MILFSLLTVDKSCFPSFEDVCWPHIHWLLMKFREKNDVCTLSIDSVSVAIEVENGLSVTYAAVH